MTVERRWWQRRPHLNPRPALWRRAWFRARGWATSERVWRAVAMVAFAGSSCLSAWTLWSIEAARCSQRKESADRIRSAISVAVDQGARELQAPPDQRVEIQASVDAAVLKAYPPPDC